MRNLVNKNIISYVSWIITKILSPKVFFFLIGLLLVQLWFTKGLVFGGTEAGVPPYNPAKVLAQIIWTWWEALGPGVSFPTISASVPFYVFMSLFQWLGFGALAIQKILFFIILYLQGLGASLLIKQVVPKIGKWQLLCGLFYIFNPFMMTYVWHRFTYTNFILSAAFPFFLYFYLQLIEKEKFRYFFYFLTTSLLASYMYSAVAQVIAIWMSVGVLYMTGVIINRRSAKKIIKMTFLTIALFIFWILTSLWWLYPLLSINTVAGSFFTHGNVDTLIALADQSTINYVIRGINSYPMFSQEDWGAVYASPMFQLLSWIPFVFALLALVLKREEKKLWFVIVLFLVGIFVAKGAAAPFGDLTIWFYSHFFFLGVIRNSFEKLGLLVVLPISVLATIGIKELFLLHRKIYLKVVIVALVLGFGIYLWPMWSDKLFGSTKYPPFFTLPEDYPQVSDFLSKELKSDNGKVLHLPITEGDSETYLWKSTYNGVELSSQLFPFASISRFLDISFIDQILKETARIFHTNNYNLQNQILTNLGVQYIVLNKDLDWHFRNTDNPLLVEKVLDSSPDLELVKSTNNLKVYKFTGQPNSEVFTVNELSMVSNIQYSNNLDFIWHNIPLNKEAFVTLFKGQQSPTSLLHRDLVFPRRIITNDASLGNNSEIIAPTPYVKYLPGTTFYPLVSMKEKVELLLTPNYERPMKMMLLTSKRLLEARLLKERDKKLEAQKAIERYTQSLDETLTLIKGLDDGALDIETLAIFKIMLDQEGNTLSEINSYFTDSTIRSLIAQNLIKINNFRKEKGFETYYTFQRDQSSQTTHTYQFVTTQQLDAELVLAINDPLFYQIENNKKMRLFLDGVEREVVIKNLNNQNWFSLGKMDLATGIHEISLPLKEDKILATTSDYSRISGTVKINKDSNLIEMTSSQDESWIEYIIPNYSPDNFYLTSFYYQVVRGATPEVHLWQDSDVFKDVTRPKAYNTIPGSLYDFSQKYYEVGISTNQPATIRLERSTLDATLRVYLPFWNNCDAMNFRAPRLCKNAQFRNVYNKESKVEIKDLQIKQSFRGNLFLDRNTQSTSYIAPEIHFIKKSPTEYLVEVNNSNPDFFLVLNEGYHSDWKVEINNEKSEIIEEKNHFLTNGYANGWLINKSGHVSLKIKFNPQENLYIGICFSVIFYIIALLLFFKDLFRRKAESEK